MVDGFSTPRERIEAYPTFAAYCAAQTLEGLARLIWDAAHQRNVFGTYPGTVGDHALTIIAEAAGAVSEASQLFGPYAHLNGPRALPEDSWSVEDDPIQNNEEYFSIPLFAKVEVTFPVTHGAPDAEAYRAYADELGQHANVSKGAADD